MKYQTTYKGRKITIKQADGGDYTAIRVLGSSIRKMGYFPNATKALIWAKKAIDSNHLDGACKVFGW